MNNIDLPTPRTTLHARYLDVLVWCKGGCRHQAPADLQKLVDTGHGDVPLTELRFRCSNCGQLAHHWAATALICRRRAAVAGRAAAMRPPVEFQGGQASSQGRRGEGATHISWTLWFVGDENLSDVVERLLQRGFLARRAGAGPAYADLTAAGRRTIEVGQTTPLSDRTGVRVAKRGALLYTGTAAASGHGRGPSIPGAPGEGHRLPARSTSGEASSQQMPKMGEGTAR